MLLHKEFEIPTLHSKFFEILMFVFLSEVALKSFCVKFSGLISKLEISEKSYSRPRIFNVFCLATCNKKLQRANERPYAYAANARRDEHGTHKHAHSMHTVRGIFVLYHVFARKQCILCSALRHECCLTLLYVTSIRDIFCPWNNRALLY